ncbi:hypothetical protein PF002_g28394 [Phytophthora fragariae]|uniref:Uncharacterized protein n=2 Tax=Phytophthora fragariae TaxID=53985 RepID=A0A6A3W125_9STRA|nr:hypothetical protein PF002_g28394 [Phytophthora fragariae]
MVSRVILCCDDYSTRVLAFWGSHVPRRVLVAEPMEEAGPEAAVRLRARTTAPGDIVQKTTWIIPYWGAMADCGQLQGRAFGRYVRSCGTVYTAAASACKKSRRFGGFISRWALVLICKLHDCQQLPEVVCIYELDTTTAGLHQVGSTAWLPSSGIRNGHTYWGIFAIASLYELSRMHLRFANALDDTTLGGSVFISIAALGSLIL